MMTEKAIPKRKLFVSGGPLSGGSSFATWLASHSPVVLGMGRYQEYWNQHLRFPPQAFTRERFFAPHVGDTWYNSLDAFAAHYDRGRQMWDEALLVGDKVQGLWRNLTGVFEHFPNARVVLMHRDPFAVARSCKERSLELGAQSWEIQRDAAAGIVEWNQYVKAVLSFFETGAPTPADPLASCLVMSYEQFTANAFDRRVLAAFLGAACPPTTALPDRARTAVPGRPRIELTDMERELIWATMDHHAAAGLRQVMDSQSLKLRRSISQSHRKGRREWYHTEDAERADIDYGEFQLPGCNYVFRGRSSAIEPGQRYVACVGSATTFGRFIKRPFAQQLEEATGVPFLNLGIGGGRPESYLVNEALMEAIARADSVLIDLMSARGYPFALFAPNNTGGNRGQFMDFYDWGRYRLQDANLEWLLKTTESNTPVFIDRIYEIGLPYLDSAQRDSIRDAVLTHYLRDLTQLVELVGRPVTFLLMTRSQPHATRGTRNPRSFAEWSGEYPHFVDQFVVDHLRNRGHTVIEARGARGFPHAVSNWKTGQPAAVFPWQKRPEMNLYYPSQEMHDDATKRLLAAPEIRRLMPADC